MELLNEVVREAYLPEETAPEDRHIARPVDWPPKT